MANIAVLVPLQSMVEQTRKVVLEDGIQVHHVKAVKTEDAVNEARVLVEAGADIIVARGLQAQLIKANTNITVIDIKLTTKELGLLVRKAKEQISKPRPAIAIVGFANLFSRMDYFDDLFGVRMLIYLGDRESDLHTLVAQASREGADLVIGGDTVCSVASRLGLAFLFTESTEDSIREALLIAVQTGLAQDSDAVRPQFDRYENPANVGVLEVDHDRVVRSVSPMAADLLRAERQTLSGRSLDEVLPGFDSDIFDRIAAGAQQRGSFTMRVAGDMMMVTVSPIRAEGAGSGALCEIWRINAMARIPEAEVTSPAGLEHVGFESVLRSSQEIGRAIGRAKLYARSKSPVLIYGETGTEKHIMALAIHNGSERKGQVFRRFDGNEFRGQSQMNVLFGNPQAAGSDPRSKGVFHAANHGTLYISDIDGLEPYCQSRLFHALLRRNLVSVSPDSALDVRVIASAKEDLVLKVRKGLFRDDLYFALGALMLELPPLRDQPWEIRKLAGIFFGRYSDLYGRTLTVTEKAYKAIEDYPWEGNLIQLEAFCERIVLAAPHRTVDDWLVRTLLGELYPMIWSGARGERVTVFKHPEAMRIVQILEKHEGNRSLAARELGISTTTLWRHMKKYGVTQTYEFTKE